MNGYIGFAEDERTLAFHGVLALLTLTTKLHVE